MAEGSAHHAWPDRRAMLLLNVVIPGVPPTVNHMYGHAFHGRKYLKPEAVAYRDMVVLLVRRARMRVEIPPDARLALWFGVWFPDARRRDLDNIEKCLTDAIAIALGFDDRHIRDRRATWFGNDRRDPRVEVYLWLMGE